MNIKYILWIAILGGFFLCTACTEEDPAVAPTPTSEIADTRLEAIAAAWAKLVREPEVREMIYREAGQRPDGDFEVLYKQLSAYRFSDGLSLKDKLSAMPYNTSSNIHELMASMPGIQVAVPVHFFNWDYSEFIPPVTYFPEGIDEKQVRKLKAFDSRDSIVELDAHRAPGMPVIVIGLSERVDAEGNVLAHYTKSALARREKETASLSGKLRMNGTRELLYRLHMEDADSVESWARGNVELRLEILRRVNGSPKTERLFFGEVNGEARGLNLDLFRWQDDEEVVFVWTEMDSGLSMPSTMNHRGTRYTVERSKGDLVAGQEVVRRDDEYGRRYFTDVLSWVQVYR